jgi:hypothetical protein
VFWIRDPDKAGLQRLGDDRRRLRSVFWGDPQASAQGRVFHFVTAQDAKNSMEIARAHTLLLRHVSKAAGASPPRPLRESFDRHNPNVLTATPRCWQNARTPMPLVSHCVKTSRQNASPRRTKRSAVACWTSCFVLSAIVSLPFANSDTFSLQNYCLNMGFPDGYRSYAAMVGGILASLGSPEFLFLGYI